MVPPHLMDGGNSGAQALNLAAQFGASPILLLGFDMHGTHWHGAHAEGLNNPRAETFSAWVACFAEAARVYGDLGVEVWNCAPSSRLAAFPSMLLDEAVERVKI